MGHGKHKPAKGLLLFVGNHSIIIVKVNVFKGVDMRGESYC